jgi:glycine/D-amino acid oxidase-like deaminating enzyme
VTRQQYAHFQVQGDAVRFSAERFPVWIDMASHFYGFPEHAPIPGAKVSLHRPGLWWDPDSLDREVSEADNRVLLDYLKQRLPELAGPVTFAKVCLYTMTPVEDFIVDRLPADPRVVFIGGLSGHGFKFTVLLGQIAARLAAGEEPGWDLSRFSLSRFEA